MSFGQFTRAVKTLRQEGWQQKNPALASMRFVELIGLDPDETVNPTPSTTMPRWQAYRPAVEHFLSKPEKSSRRFRIVVRPSEEEHPKIDEALARAMYNQQFNQLAGEPQWDDISQLVVTRAVWLERALTVRAMLLRAGYRIELDPDFLLRKGRDEVGELK